MIDNVRVGAHFGAQLRGVKNEEAQIKEAISLSGMQGKEGVLAGNLNLFDKKRAMIAIGRGLMSNAKFLAVDEPSLGLAPYLKTEVFHKISEVNKGGITVLLVEQDVAEASELADRIYLMEGGRIVFEGRKEEVLNNERVKGTFLGI